MKMDASEPFNVPMNPEALGIPVSLIFVCTQCTCMFWSSELEGEKCKAVREKGEKSSITLLQSLKERTSENSLIDSLNCSSHCRKIHYSP